MFRPQQTWEYPVPMGWQTPSVAAVRSEKLIKACVGKRVCGSEAWEEEEEEEEEEEKPSRWACRLNLRSPGPPLAPQAVHPDGLQEPCRRLCRITTAAIFEPYFVLALPARKTL